MKQSSRRSRGRGNARRSNSPRNQTIESNGPDVRIRGSLNQVLDKYLTLARDASSSGDYIAAENFYQHAEHYQRIKNANGGQSSGGQRPRPDGAKGNGVGGASEPEARSPRETASAVKSGGDGAPEKKALSSGTETADTDPVTS